MRWISSPKPARLLFWLAIWLGTAGAGLGLGLARAELGLLLWAGTALGFGVYLALGHSLLKPDSLEFPRRGDGPVWADGPVGLETCPLPPAWPGFVWRWRLRGLPEGGGAPWQRLVEGAWNRDPGERVRPGGFFGSDGRGHPGAAESAAPAGLAAPGGPVGAPPAGPVSSAPSAPRVPSAPDAGTTQPWTAGRWPRGVHHLTWDLELSDRLGLGTRRWRVRDPQPVLVRRWRLERPAPEAPRSAQGELSSLSPRRRPGEDLFDQRRYVPGDDLKRLNWKAWAHSGELMVRQAELAPPPEGLWCLGLDTTPPPDLRADLAPRLLDLRLAEFAARALAAAAAGQNVAVFWPEASQVVPLNPAEGFEEALARVRVPQSRPAGGLPTLCPGLQGAVLVWSLWDSPWCQALSARPDLRVEVITEDWPPGFRSGRPKGWNILRWLTLPEAGRSRGGL